MRTVVMMALSMMQTTIPSVAGGEDVVVLGSRQGYRLDGRALRAAASAFASQRARYAPQASLLFLVSRTAAAPAIPVRLTATDGRHRAPIALTPEGVFAMPDMPAGRWWLEANLPRRAVRIEPLTLSPTSSRRDYRLGDARLQCRVFWAMEKATAPILVAPLVGMIDVAGPCTNRKIEIFVTAPAPVREVAAREGARTVPGRVSRTRRSYAPPVSDKTVGDEARVQVATD